MPGCNDNCRCQTEIPRPPSLGRLFFTVGTARSGKSTYANQTWLHGEDRDGHRIVWSTDNLRLALTGERYTKEIEPLAHTIKHYALKTLLSQGYVVLVDGTHTTDRSIKSLIELDYLAQPLMIGTSEEICVQRAIATNQSDLIPVIRRHNQQMKKLMGERDFMWRLRQEVLEDWKYRWPPC